jgi:hypothetical protein
VGDDAVDYSSGLDDAGPADEAWHAVAAFPIRVLLATERRSAAVGPAEGLDAVIGGEDDDSVIRDPQVFQFLEHHADLIIELGHACTVKALLRDHVSIFLQVRPDVHASSVVPDEERLAGLYRAVHRIEHGIQEAVKLKGNENARLFLNSNPLRSLGRKLNTHSSLMLD